MDSDFAKQFASEWRDAWNAHDVDAILRHFADEIVFTSPIAQRIVDGSEGVIHGASELRACWSEGLRRSPDLHFEIGVDTIVINYRNHTGGLVNEVLTFHGPLVIQEHATYLGA